MDEPWYLRYFTSDFWAFARHEYTEARTTLEVGYLHGVLTELAPGKRILDLGCGVGRHAIALAKAGYQVTGVDVSAWALEQAHARATDAGVGVAWRQLDLLAAQSWNLPVADAAICIQAFGWGEDADQVRMLRTLHRHLCPDGLLVLDHSNLTAILRAYAPRAHFRTVSDTFEFFRNFDPLTGRSAGELLVRHGDGRTARLSDNVRLYQPHEVHRLLRTSGFDVERVDADFSSYDRPGMDTRYIQFVARRAPTPTPRLPIRVRETGEAGALDLRWAPDEADYVRPALDRALRSVIAQGVSLVDQQARHYAVDDPLGSLAAAPLARHFDCRIEPDMVAFGAGSTSILRDLGTLAVSGSVVHSPFGHPDLIARARQLGAVTLAIDPAGDARRFEEALRRHRPVLAVVDRPSIMGDMCGLAEVERLAASAARTGTVLVLDEACATYTGPLASAARLAAVLDNIVVVRSMSKGYCCGGLRVGFAVSSPGVALHVQAALTPLATSALAMQVTLRLLDEGDIFGPLRKRISDVKPSVVAQLRTLGLSVVAGDLRLPWVTLEADDHTRSLLRRCRIIAKHLGFAGPSGSSPQELLRISVPLSEARVRAFRAAIRRIGVEIS